MRVSGHGTILADASEGSEDSQTRIDLEPFLGRGSDAFEGSADPADLEPFWVNRGEGSEGSEDGVGWNHSGLRRGWRCRA